VRVELLKVATLQRVAAGRTWSAPDPRRMVLATTRCQPAMKLALAAVFPS
jgi:hypothetical protein